MRFNHSDGMDLDSQSNLLCLDWTLLNVAIETVSKKHMHNSKSLDVATWSAILHSNYWSWFSFF